MEAKKFSMSHDELRKMAIQHITKSRHLKKFKNVDEDLITDVSLAIWTAHNKFDDKKGKALKTFIIDHCNWTILKFLDNKQRKKNQISNVDKLYKSYEHKEFVQHDNADTIEVLMKKTLLTTKEKQVIQLKYFDKMSPKEIRQTMKVSKTYVNKIHQDAIRELRATAERINVTY